MMAGSTGIEAGVSNLSQVGAVTYAAITPPWDNPGMTNGLAPIDPATCILTDSAEWLTFGLPARQVVTLN